MAPIDIIISIIARHKADVEEAKKEDNNKKLSDYEYAKLLGRIEALEELTKELEGFKKLFS